MLDDEVQGMHKVAKVLCKEYNVLYLCKMHKSAGHEYITKQKKTGEIEWKQENRRWRQNRKQIPTTLSFFESGSVFAAPIFCPPTSAFTRDAGNQQVLVAEVSPEILP